MSFKYKRQEVQMSMPQDELDLLNEKETSISEDIKNIGRATMSSFGVGGASSRAKFSAISKSIYSSQYKNFLLDEEKRQESFEKAKLSEEEEIAWKEKYVMNQADRDGYLGKIDNAFVKGTGHILTGMISDYSDAFSLNTMMAMNMATQGVGASYGASKTTFLAVDTLMDALEEGSLNFTTQSFMLGKDKVDKTEVAWSAITGAIGGKALPMLGSASGMVVNKVVGEFGGEAFEKMSKEIIEEAIGKNNTNISKIRTKNEIKYGKGNFDKLIVNDATKIQIGIDNVSTLTGNLRPQSTSVITVNNKGLAEWEASEKILQDIIQIKVDSKPNKIAVNDIGVNNKMAKEELFVPKKLADRKSFVGEKTSNDVIKEIETEIKLYDEGAKGVRESIDSITEMGEIKDVGKINDFIEDYGLEDTIPLVTTKIDGTVETGTKTPEEFKKDFKILLQLFSDPIDKSTPEAKFKNITMRKSTKLVKNQREIIKNLNKEATKRLGRSLKVKERSKLLKNYIKENLYNSYKYSENRAMGSMHFNTSLEVNGNRYGAKEIFNLLKKDGDEGFLGKALFDGKLETKNKGAGLEMRKFIKRFDDSIKLFVDGNFKTDIDNIHNSLLFDSNKLYYDSLNEADTIRLTNKNGELDFSNMTDTEKLELDVFAFDVFSKKNKDIFVDKKKAKIFWDNFVAHGKAPSKLEGTVLHQMGAMQKFYDEKVIDKNQLAKIVDRYKVSDRVLYNKMVNASKNANALYETFGYKPKTTMNRMFGNYAKANPLSAKSRWLFGESKQAWTLKTDTNDFLSMIFADEIGMSKGKLPFVGQGFIKYKQKIDSIGIGITDLPSEIISHVAKRLIIGKEPLHKIVYQTVKTMLEMHTLTKKLADHTTDPVLRDSLGALGSYHEFLITKGDTDYSGVSLDVFDKLSPTMKAITKAESGINKANRIRQTDLFGDKLAMVATSLDINKFGKIGYAELKSKSKHNYIASKLDEFGITEDTFNLMVNAPRGDFGIRDVSKYSKKDLEKFGGVAETEMKKMRDFMNFFSSKIGFTKPDIEFTKMKNLYETDDSRMLSALLMYWKKTMFTKMKDSGALLGTMNTYGGLGKTFDWVNMDHYTRVILGAMSVGMGNYPSNKLDEIVYGYEIEEAENLTEFIFDIANQSGVYTMTDTNSLSRALNQIVNGKTSETKIKGAVKLVAPAKVVRQVERVIEAD